MSRGLWFVAGAGAGLYAAVRGRRAAEALSADGLRDRVNGVVAGARLLRQEVAQGAADAEPVVRERLGLAGPRELARPGPTDVRPPESLPQPAAQRERGTT